MGTSDPAFASMETLERELFSDGDLPGDVGGALLADLLCDAAARSATERVAPHEEAVAKDDTDFIVSEDGDEASTTKQSVQFAETASAAALVQLADILNGMLGGAFDSPVLR
jgi:hypothetical protein